MSYIHQEEHELFMPPKDDAELVRSVYGQRLAVLDSGHAERVERAVRAIERLEAGVTQNGIYPTATQEQSRQATITVDELTQQAADKVMQTGDYELLSRDPLKPTVLNQYIDAINDLNPQGKMHTPPSDIERARQEIAAQSDQHLQDYVHNGMLDIEAYLASQASVEA